MFESLAEFRTVSAEDVGSIVEDNDCARALMSVFSGVRKEVGSSAFKLANDS